MYGREINGRVHTFGVSGKLIMNALVMYDHQTDTLWSQFLSRGVTIAGNPESCIKTIKMYEDIGDDQIMLIMQTETIPHDQVMESIELYGKEGIPAFADAKVA